MRAKYVENKKRKGISVAFSWFWAQTFLKNILLLSGLKMNSSRGKKVWSLSEGRKVPNPVRAIGQQEMSEHYVIDKYKHTDLI